MIDEGEATTNAARKVASVAPLPAPCAAVAVAPVEEKRISKWKLTKKINRIYGDWLDNLTPPHLSPEVMN